MAAPTHQDSRSWALALRCQRHQDAVSLGLLVPEVLLDNETEANAGVNRTGTKPRSILTFIFHKVVRGLQDAVTKLST